MDLEDYPPAERRRLVEAELAERHPGAVLFDGLDGALIGIATSFPHDEPVAVYSEDLIVELKIAEGATRDEAWDDYLYNTAGLGGLPGLPLILTGFGMLERRHG